MLYHLAEAREATRLAWWILARNLTLVAILVFVIALQVGLGLSGEFWQDNYQTDGPHVERKPIFADRNHFMYSRLIACITINFVESLSIILLCINAIHMDLNCHHVRSLLVGWNGMVLMECIIRGMIKKRFARQLGMAIWPISCQAAPFESSLIHLV